MAALLQDLITYYTEALVVQGSGIDTFMDFVPDSPTTLVALQEYAGQIPVHNIGIGDRKIQISARSDSATVAHDKSWELYNALQAATEVVQLSDERWAICKSTQMPIKLYVDTMQRVVYGFNITLTTKFD